MKEKKCLVFDLNKDTYEYYSPQRKENLSKHLRSIALEMRLQYGSRKNLFIVAFDTEDEKEEFKGELMFRMKE